MAVALTILAALSLAVWLYLLFGHGGFWRADQRLDAPGDTLDAWPAVAAVVPARNEAAVIGQTLRSLLAQDYPGDLVVIVVDDESDDGTAELARGADDRVVVVGGAARPAGWVGKTWALAQGVEAAAPAAPEARYLWFSDADIEHRPGVLRALVAKAEAERLDLVSLMARLHCARAWERLLIPAFVFFFQMLYPFRRVNDPARATAAAAGGCMLVRRDALAAAGGLDAIAGALIDDCALARALKPGGPIWLGLATESRSIRAYAGLGEIWDMVARSAYTQLGHSPMLLAGTVVGMTLIYLVPPATAIAGVFGGFGPAAGLGAAGWLAMAVGYAPTLRFYRQPAVAGVVLPAVATLYTLMTLDSALRWRRGEGGRWKGRRYTKEH